MLTAIDLFAGVGGLSLGACRAGFDVRSAVEIDPLALAYHAKNFPLSGHLSHDVGALKGRDLLEYSRVNTKSSRLDLLMGGPPCQGFSLIGKKLDSDPRNALFGHFFRLVRETMPRVFVAENVPGILAIRNAEVVNAAFSILPKCYELLEPIEIRASDFGAPTSRTRIFFVGFDRRYARVKLDPDNLLRQIDFIVTVGHALRGLEHTRLHDGASESAWGRVGKVPADAFFARVKGQIPPGVGCPDAIRRLTNESLVSGCVATHHTHSVMTRFRAVQPGKVDAVSRAPRLDAAGFCPTLRAGTGPDKGSFQSVRPIHPREDRVITPREAARLQGFPDWFVFHPTKWHSFRQIGNSVSPIIAETLLTSVRIQIT